MWKGTGRSGYGDQSILGDYNDWEGLSMNGRQWKNRQTKETRNLSGADYWHQRKAIEPKMLEDIPTFVNGRPNISAFAEPVQQKPVEKKKKSVADSIDLAEKHLARMEKLSEELDEEYFAGEIDEERYELLRYKMDERLIKAFHRVEKENAPIWQKQDREFKEKSLTFSLDEIEWNTAAKNKEKSFKSLAKTADKSLLTGKGCVSMALRDCKETNVFLIGTCKVLGLIKKIKGED